MMTQPPKDHMITQPPRENTITPPEEKPLWASPPTDEVDGPPREPELDVKLGAGGPGEADDERGGRLESPPSLELSREPSPDPRERPTLSSFDPAHGESGPDLASPPANGVEEEEDLSSNSGSTSSREDDGGEPSPPSVGC
jgi:hypothetical protein